MVKVRWHFHPMKPQRLHSKVILDSPASACLYYLLRARDTKGQGWITISMSYLEEVLQRGRKAIVRRIKKGLGRFFQEYELDGDRLYIKYCALEKVKLSSGGVFASAKVLWETFLSVTTAKRAAYEIAISRQQTACRKAIRRGISSGKYRSEKQVFDPAHIQSCQRDRRCEHMRGVKPVRVFLPKHIQPVGASQITLASALGRCRQTLIAWCKHFPSLQVWKDQPSGTPRMGDTYRCYRRSKTGRKMKRAYKRMPNLYFPQEEGSYIITPSRLESHETHKKVLSPAQETAIKEATRESTLAYILSLKTPRNFESLSDRLLFHFGKEALLELAYAVIAHIKPAQFWGEDKKAMVIGKLREHDNVIIAEHIQRTIEDVHEEDQGDIKLLLEGFIKRLRNKKSAIPPTAREPYPLRLRA